MIAQLLCFHAHGRGLAKRLERLDYEDAVVQFLHLQDFLGGQGVGGYAFVDIGLLFPVYL